MASSPPRTLLERICDARGCSPEEALERLAKELQTPSQRFWSTVLFPGCGPLRERYREVVKDLSGCRDLSEIKSSLVYWRQRTPYSGFLGKQFRVHTSQALTLFERLSGS
jgi:hypothetical protein